MSTDPVTSANIRSALANVEPDLMIAVETLIRMATKYNVLFSGMMIRTDEPVIVSIIGNATQRGYDAADLFRQFAQIVEDAAARGAVGTHQISKPN